MSNYITSDKVGEFCQAMFNAGLLPMVNKDYISVQLSDKSCLHVDIYTKISFGALVKGIIAEDAELKRLAEFDTKNPIC